MKPTTLSALLCISSVLAATAFAQQDTTGGTTPSTGAGSTTMGTSGQQANDLRASKAIGAEVRTSQGQKLGKVNDLILNPSNGRVDFAVIDWNNKLVPVPFTLLNASMTQGRGGFLSPTGQELTFTANVDQSKLQNAPTIDKSRWTDIQQPGWSQKIYSYYGVQPSGSMGAPGMGTETTPSTGTGTGTGTGKGTETTPDSGTSPK